MKKIVISQPMFFPWMGIFEQLKLCDIFVHYDDVQLPLGRSFITRVQIKTSQGIQWLTVPVKKNGLQMIKDVEIDNSQLWREKHLKTIKHNYSKAPFFDEMFDLVNDIYSCTVNGLSDLNCLIIEKISDYFSFRKTFLKSSDMMFSSKSSQHLLDIVQSLNGSVYITGHGAKNYLDHSIFENAGISVQYMRYNLSNYKQIHGNFTPFVSIIDLIANMGKQGVSVLNSQSENWQQFISRPQQQ